VSADLYRYSSEIQKKLGETMYYMEKIIKGKYEAVLKAAVKALKAGASAYPPSIPWKPWPPSRMKIWSVCPAK